MVKLGIFIKLNLPLILANLYLLVQVEISAQYFQMTASSSLSAVLVLSDNDHLTLFLKSGK